MKTIKFLFLLIILGLLGLLVYQNLDYFMAKQALSIDLKISGWHWTTPELPTLAFWGICFGIGLLITGFKGLATAFSLGREIKKKNAGIDSLKKEIKDLKSRLDVFIHDPYIKAAKGSNPGDSRDKDPASAPVSASDDTQPHDPANA
ncbi:LapA family protein [Desulfospira joergensenii]|uniref:LapA family protein n=1 Tax=Desulfospira joergensenii TaxID=53329 RepID=UPI0003B65D59|nr:LapA family protein [Desulfospira joergensenii]